MAKKRSSPIREKGKIRLSEYFKELKKGDIVSIINEKKDLFHFPRRISGKVGRILDKRGEFYSVIVSEGAKSKTYIIHPINLRRTKW